MNHLQKKNSRVHTDTTRYVRGQDSRSERRIINNRIRRQREMKKHAMILLMTLCLIITFSFTLNTFRSNAKDESAASYKYYKSIPVSCNDTLWSIAECYMDEEHYDSITDYINEIKRVNSLAGDTIHDGNYLIVPYFDYDLIG